jgi:FkbM family methyltransferase
VDATEQKPHGALAPGWFDRAVIAATSRLPANWLGLRLAILLRRLVTMRLPGGALDVERWGLRLRLHPLDNGCEKGLLFTPQMFEPEERAELAAEIARKRGADPFIFVDVGGNVGLFSLLVAAQSKGRARILAFEPEPGNFARLAFNVAANPGVPIKPLQLALSDEAGELAIELDRRDRGGTRAHRLDALDARPDTVRVPCRTLLAVLGDEGVARIDALKLDVEGMEDAVLMPFFRAAPPSLWPNLIVIEDARELWSADLFAELAKRGYAVTSRSKLNVMLRRTAQPSAIGTASATERPPVVTSQR